ncbi:Acyl-CoA synthetase family member 3, mitochondrial [Bagarius yarrelli]|uniref:Acyl-CoA synthetase family member 3, mitochondrial n=1 Tax=Bagarius yarrelli TaxID=175774 RepID=A0A556TLL6_BAGYA|nr:Acyl-CoA synthetase family member 3, mitochondrial [Bagarius yarrelli]
MLRVSTVTVWKSFQRRLHSKHSRYLLKWLTGNIVQKAWRSSGIQTTKSREHVTPVFTKALGYKDKVAIIDETGQHSYSCLYHSSRGLAAQINQALTCRLGYLQNKRISFLCANDASYTVAQWATWMCGGTAVPLYRKHPVSELEYIITDSESSLLLAGEPYTDTLEPLAKKLGLPCLHLPPTANLHALHKAESHCQPEEETTCDWAKRPAMIIYTSGTTGRPKGVLHTHGSLQAMGPHASCCQTSVLRRLMVSGSAALPQTVLEHWKEITGHILLERYGMTEIGMALSNPLNGQRIPGDTAVYKDKVYWIMGRTSVDIIKSGGYKISALDVERHLLAHPDIADVAVIGAPDSTWGQKVVAVVQMKNGKTITLSELKAWAREHMSPYTIPTGLIMVEEMPRNQMGKVNKKDLLWQFFPH